MTTTSRQDRFDAQLVKRVNAVSKQFAALTKLMTKNAKFLDDARHQRVIRFLTASTNKLNERVEEARRPKAPAVAAESFSLADESVSEATA